MNSSATPTTDNYYGPANPGDPYEGELFVWFLDLFANWTSDAERDQLWIAKRPALVPVNYTTQNGTNITVQRGYWYSSHEQWKLSLMPYMDVPLLMRVFSNTEKVRTVHSMEKNIAGMFACVNDVVAGPRQPIPDYVSNTGIPCLATLTNISWRLDLVTPYAVFPTALINISVAAVWYHNMLLGPRMQGPYGSTESISLNGTEFSPILTWDSKITSLFSFAGGSIDLVRVFLESRNLYPRFVTVLQREYSLAFGDTLSGEEISFGLPNTAIPSNIHANFTGC